MRKSTIKLFAAIAAMVAAFSVSSCDKAMSSSDNPNEPAIDLSFTFEKGGSYSKSKTKDCDYIINVPAEGGIVKIESSVELSGHIDFEDVKSLYLLTPEAQGEICATCSNYENKITLTVESAHFRKQNSKNFEIKTKSGDKKVTLSLVQEGDPGYDKELCLTLRGQERFAELNKNISELADLIEKKADAFIAGKMALSKSDTDLNAIWTSYENALDALLGISSDELLNPYLELYSASINFLMASYFGGMPIVEGPISMTTSIKKLIEESPRVDISDILELVVKNLSYSFDEKFLSDLGMSYAYVNVLRAKAYMELGKWDEALASIRQAKNQSLDKMLFDVSDIASDEAECEAIISGGQVESTAGRTLWYVPALRRSGLGKTTLDMTWELTWPIPEKILVNTAWHQNPGY